MCGIIGVIGSSDAISSLQSHRLKHRGPDGSGYWQSPEGEYPVKLAHTRLSILDVSDSGRQPFLSDNGRYIFTFNGEIYNFIELRSLLESKGYFFKTQSDTEVFFVGLIHYGPAFQEKCNGMWSFCLWDQQEKKALFGRDRFGKKPFYYYLINNKAIAFSSEMKGLYPFMKSIRAADDINRHLIRLFDYESSEHCVVDGVKRLRAGHFMQFNKGEVKVTRWWNTLDNLEPPPLKYEDQVERWRELFLDAVKIRMRSDVRIGTALSGGLDSSATVCAMAYISSGVINNQRQSKDWQHAFCSHYPGSSLDEFKWANYVASSRRIRLDKVVIKPELSPWSISEMFYKVEDPYLTLPLPMLSTYQEISKAGVKVTLDGHGADELLSGYGSINTAYRDFNVQESAELTQIINSLSTGEYVPLKGNAYYNWVKNKVIELVRYGIRDRKDLLKFLIGKGTLELASYKLNYEDQARDEYKAFDPLTRELYEMFHVTILPTLLRNYDRYSMASGVEVRMPFMDHRLVTYTFSLPLRAKIGGGFTKRIMRDALKGIVPELVRTRRDKIGWNAPMHEWLNGPLNEEVEDFIYKKNRDQYLIRCWQNFKKIPNPNFLDGQRLWFELMPKMWLHSMSTWR